MDIFEILTMIGGLSLFLFGMNIMGQALERRAGDQLRNVLGKLTTGRFIGLLSGLGVTAIIQSSSATTVMVVGFVNSGLMTLKQAIHVIMGANIGTTVTAWILSMAGIESSNFFVQLLKPTSFTPICAAIGIVLYMFCKSPKKKDTGMVLLGFATLMFGMETMSNAVSGLSQVPQFQQLFLLFKNPILGMLAGAFLTALIQSSSASVGILQALAVTGKVTYSAAIPIIMGQNIGTCVTAILSSIGASKNAKRAALVHLLFNVMGTVIWLSVFCLVQLFVSIPLLDASASLLGIAVAHSVFNFLCTFVMLPLNDFLERLVCSIIPDAKEKEIQPELDERLFTTPPIALKQSHEIAAELATLSVGCLKESLHAMDEYDEKEAVVIRENEEKTDRYEDLLNTYLLHLNAKQISEDDRCEITKLLKIINDFERIGDHGVQLLECMEQFHQKKLSLSKKASLEWKQITSAVNEILDYTLQAFLENDVKIAENVEPLEQVIDHLKESMRTSHIIRLQQGDCSIEMGFIYSEMLTHLERTSDHCSNIAACLIDMAQHKMNLHASLRDVRSTSVDFREKFNAYMNKYRLDGFVEQTDL